MKESKLNHLLPDLYSESETISPLAEILDSSYDGIWICDKYGKILFVNKSSEKINPATKAEEVVGKTVEEVFQRGLIGKPVTTEVIKTKKQVTKMYEAVGGKRLLITGNPVLDKQNEISFVVINLRDITELDKLRYELDQTKALNNYLANLNKPGQKDPDPYLELVRSVAMRKVYETGLKAADVDSTVLLFGESGVGKGFFAKYIHLNSHRKKGPFIRLNCAAIPEPLIESELFGYEAGAFTGARATGKQGLIEKSEGGTLFLDELGDISQSTQVKLLRFLEDTEIARVGGISFQKVNTRIIAATHHNLEEMVEKGLFRKDLFFRVNVISIEILSLRERPEDIPMFINYFLNYFCKKYKREKFIQARATDYLCHYPYPGNIRELSNIVEQLVVLTSNTEIEVEDLPERILKEASVMLTVGYDGKVNLRQAVSELEKKMITQALTIYGSQRQAAKALGVDQATVIRKMRRYGLRSELKIHNDA